MIIGQHGLHPGRGSADHDAVGDIGQQNGLQAIIERRIGKETLGKIPAIAFDDHLIGVARQGVGDCSATGADEVVARDQHTLRSVSQHYAAGSAGCHGDPIANERQLITGLAKAQTVGIGLDVVGLDRPGRGALNGVRFNLDGRAASAIDADCTTSDVIVADVAR